MEKKSVYASEVYAQSQGNECFGFQECHWCGAPCGDLFPHDDLLIHSIQIGIRKLHTYAKRPNNTYICMGCWLWRRKRLTITFMDADYKDGRCPVNFSWLITPDYAKAIKSTNKKEIYGYLLNPEKVFVLSLITEKSINHLHCAIANAHEVVTAETELFFTIDNIVLSYTIYELEDALTSSPQGKSPGIISLIHFFGPIDIPFKEQIKKRVGRPTLEESSHHTEQQRLKRIIAA